MNAYQRIYHGRRIGSFVVILVSCFLMLFSSCAPQTSRVTPKDPSQPTKPVSTPRMTEPVASQEVKEKADLQESPEPTKPVPTPRKTEPLASQEVKEKANLSEPLTIEIVKSEKADRSQPFVSGGSITGGKLLWNIEHKTPKEGYVFFVLEMIFHNMLESDMEFDPEELKVETNQNEPIECAFLSGWSAKEGQKQAFMMIKSLASIKLPAGEDYEKTALLIVPENYQETVSFQYKNGTPFTTKLQDKSDGAFMSAAKFTTEDLFIAIEKGEFVKIKEIIDQGIDINCRDDSENTPLIMASFYGHTEIVEFLIANGAKVNMGNNTGTTALGVAAYKGNVQIVKLLLASGVSPNSRINDQGGMALMVTAIHGHKDLANLLLEKGANVSAKNNDGTTALIFAAMNGHIEIMELLLNKGADANVRDSYGSTPLMFAAVKGHSDVAEFLIAKGADVNAVMKTGATALMMAAMNGHEAVVKVLLNSGADVSIRDKKGQCALDLARKTNKSGIIKLLEQR